MTETAFDSWSPPDLGGCVALVTGASRGVGKGIAVALGDAGATVYLTGRSTRDGGSTEQLPGTIDDTADEVTRRGGHGIAVRCDHGDDTEVEHLFGRIAADHDRLDLLVNNAWGGYERWDEARFDAPFWEQPLWRYDLCLGGVRSQFTASRLAAPLMIDRGAGLVVGIGFTDGDTYLGQVAYDVAKFACDRLTRAMAQELGARGVHAICLHPGFVRTERVAAAWEAIGEGPAQVAHTPEYVGRAVVALAALAADGERAGYSGRCIAVGDLAQEIGFTDVDGRQPPAFALEGRRTLANRMERLHRAGGRG